jgi:hypothetical protein
MGPGLNHFPPAWHSVHLSRSSRERSRREATRVRVAPRFQLRRTCSAGLAIAFRGTAQENVPVGSGVGAQGPDHLTFDLADASKMSLSFYGNHPGPGVAWTSRACSSLCVTPA